MRPITSLMVALVMIAATSTAMVQSGVTDDLGVNPDLGIDEQVNQSEQSASGLQTQRDPGAVTFIGAIISSVNVLLDAFKLIFTLPTLAMNLGAPEWLAVWLSAPLWLIFAIFIIYMLTQRDARK